MTFKDRYIAHYGISAERFSEHVFNRCLYRHAVPVAWLIKSLEPQVFNVDYDLISDVGAVKRRRDFHDMVSSWATHPDNRGFIRRMGHVRISITRLRAEVTLIMSINEELSMSMKPVA
jgi:hypothetical protein